MPAETNRQANTAKMAYAFKHGKLEASEVNSSVKQMSKMSDAELKKFMTLKEGEENSLDSLGEKYIYLKQEFSNYNGKLADFLGPYFKRAANDFQVICRAFDIEDLKDLDYQLEDKNIDFEDELDILINRYHIVIPEQSIKEGEEKRELLMDKKSSRAYEEIFNAISRFYSDKKNTHLSLRGNVIHFEKHNPNVGEWDEEQQLALAKKQWDENGLVQTWALPKSQDSFHLELLDLRSDQIGIKVDALILLNDFLEEDSTTGDIAVASGPVKLDVMQRRGPKELEFANILEREGEILKESEGGAFAYFYKVGEKWWKEWVNNNVKQYDIVYDKQDRLYLVYEGNTHILTYNVKTGEVFTDKQFNELTSYEATLVEKIEKITGKKITLL